MGIYVFASDPIDQAPSRRYSVAEDRRRKFDLHETTRAMREETLTVRLDKSRTGMAASSYIHVDHVGTRVTGIRLTEKGKDRSTLDDLLGDRRRVDTNDRRDK